MTREEMIKNLIKEMSECGLFIGKYDTKHGSASFMHGVLTVMEYLANEVSEEYRDEFTSMFLQNMVDNQNKA